MFIIRQIKKKKGDKQRNYRIFTNKTYTLSKLSNYTTPTYTINPLAELSNRAKSYKDKSQIKPNVPLV